MSRFQFSLAKMYGFVFLLALGMVALVNATPWWAASAFTLTILIFLLSLVRLVYCRNQTRAFWVGFNILGWGYMTLAFGPWFSNYISPHLVTTEVLRVVYPQVRRTIPLAPNETEPAWVRRTESELINGSRVTVAVVVTQREFFRVGHCVFALLLALIGGIVARYFYSVRDKQP